MTADSGHQLAHLAAHRDQHTQPDITPATRHAALHTIAAYAHNTQDLLDLCDALGLDPIHDRRRTPRRSPRGD